MLRSLKGFMDQRYFRHRGFHIVEIDSDGIRQRNFTHEGTWRVSRGHTSFDVNYQDENAQFLETFALALAQCTGQMPSAPIVVLIDDGFVRHAPLHMEQSSSRNLDKSYAHWLAERFLGVKQTEYSTKVESRGPSDVWITAYPQQIVAVLNKMRETGTEICATLPKSSLYLLNPQFHGRLNLILKGASWSLLALTTTGETVYYRSNIWSDSSLQHLQAVIKTAESVLRCFSLSNQQLELRLVVAPCYVADISTEGMAYLNSLSQCLLLDDNVVDNLCIDLVLSGLV